MTLDLENRMRKLIREDSVKDFESFLDIILAISPPCYNLQRYLHSATMSTGFFEASVFTCLLVLSRKFFRLYIMIIWYVSSLLLKIVIHHVNLAFSCKVIWSNICKFYNDREPYKYTASAFLSAYKFLHSH